MVSLSNHEVERVEAWFHDLVLRPAQDEVYCTKTKDGVKKSGAYRP